MPIRHDQRWYYPIDWRELSRVIRFERAHGHCEHCRRPHGQWVVVGPGGLWWDERGRYWRGARGRRLTGVPTPARLAAREPALLGFPPPVPPRSRVILATAHLDHDPGNNGPRNLAALCQRCHLAHDRDQHRRQRWATLFYVRALGDLFEGLYKARF